MDFFFIFFIKLKPDNGVAHLAYLSLF